MFSRVLEIVYYHTSIRRLINSDSREIFKIKMPYPVWKLCDHEKNRNKLCGPCGKKINFRDQKIEQFRITEKYEKLIQKFINPNFLTSNSKYPLSICTNCRKMLAEHDQSNFHRSLKTMPDYEEIVLPRKTRSTDDNATCQCYICLTGRHKGLIKFIKKLKIGESLHLSPKISRKKFQNEKSGQLQSTFSVESKQKITLCPLCFQKTGRGISHKCITRTRSQSRQADNILQLTNNLAQQQKEQVYIVHS